MTATTLATLIGEERPEDVAQQVLAIEHWIAQAHWDVADTRDPMKAYNPMTLDQLQSVAPGFDWRAFARSANLSESKS